MAKSRIKTFRCDGPGCSAQVVREGDQLGPKGWITADLRLWPTHPVPKPPRARKLQFHTTLCVMRYIAWVLHRPLEEPLRAAAERLRCGARHPKQTNFTCHVAITEHRLDHIGSSPGNTFPSLCWEAEDVLPPLPSPTPKCGATHPGAALLVCDLDCDHHGPDHRAWWDMVTPIYWPVDDPTSPRH